MSHNSGPSWNCAADVTTAGQGNNQATRNGSHEIMWYVGAALPPLPCRYCDSHLGLDCVFACVHGVLHLPRCLTCQVCLQVCLHLSHLAL